jgi:hypothetical protein
MDTLPYKMSFTLQSIHDDPDTIQKFVELLLPKLPCTFIDAHNYACTLCPELRSFCESNKQKLARRLKTDKGLRGKLTEYYIFGRVPNNDASPDTKGGDVKGTTAKVMTNSLCNAKERVTGGNVGDTNNPSTLQHIVDSANFQENKSYAKLRKGFIAVFQWVKSYQSAEEILQEKLITLFHYDLESLPVEIRTVIDEDYARIVKCVRENAVSEKGQQYLHIHPHGAKGSKTRAFGFTKKFVTLLICHCTGRPLIKNGRSWGFNI